MNSESDLTLPTQSARTIEVPAPGQRAADLQWQHYQVGLNARGSFLGVGRRETPTADQLVSYRAPVSAGQFAGGPHAHAIMGDENDE